jgi:DeoR/GlpR family transcriptional regulator of sugar metabolism
VYGGAVLEAPPEAEPPFAVRQISQQNEKDLIGRVAAEWVKDGDVLFRDGGTTTQFIVPHLHDRKNLTVVTCGLNIIAELAKYPQIATIVIGGEFHIESQSFTGVMALEALQSYIRCDKAFISCGGVSAKYGVTNRILDRIALKRKAMEISRQVAVIADGSKIGIAVLGHVAPIDSFDLLITDNGAPKSELAAIAALDVEIRTPIDQKTNTPPHELVGRS